MPAMPYPFYSKGLIPWKEHNEYVMTGQSPLCSSLYQSTDQHRVFVFGATGAPLANSQEQLLDQGIQRLPSGEVRANLGGSEKQKPKLNTKPVEGHGGSHQDEYHTLAGMALAEQAQCSRNRPGPFSRGKITRREMCLDLIAQALSNIESVVQIEGADVLKHSIRQDPRFWLTRRETSRIRCNPARRSTASTGQTK